MNQRLEKRFSFQWDIEFSSNVGEENEDLVEVEWGREKEEGWEKDGGFEKATRTQLFQTATTAVAAAASLRCLYFVCSVQTNECRTYHTTKFSPMTTCFPLKNNKCRRNKKKHESIPSQIIRNWHYAFISNDQLLLLL